MYFKYHHVKVISSVEVFLRPSQLVVCDDVRVVEVRARRLRTRVMNGVLGESADLLAQPWIHVGRAWTNGEQFFALDAHLLPAWRSDDEQLDELFYLAPILAQRIRPSF